jgi:hypothetical protein
MKCNTCPNEIEEHRYRSKYGNYCKPCVAKIRREEGTRRRRRLGKREYDTTSSPEVRRERYKEYQRKKSLDRYYKNKLWVEQYKLDCGGCYQCGEKHPAALDFHHIDPSIKSFNISTAITSKTIAGLQEEIKKCVVICANCHRKLHSKG